MVINRSDTGNKVSMLCVYYLLLRCYIRRCYFKINTDVLSKKTKQMSNLRKIGSVRLDDDITSISTNEKKDSSVELTRNSFIIFTLGMLLGCALGKKLS